MIGSLLQAAPVLSDTALRSCSLSNARNVQSVSITCSKGVERHPPDAGSVEHPLEMFSKVVARSGCRGGRDEGRLSERAISEKEIVHMDELSTGQEPAPSSSQYLSEADRTEFVC
jgi:hypothetical protein